MRAAALRLMTLCLLGSFSGAALADEELVAKATQYGIIFQYVKAPAGEGMMAPPAPAAQAPAGWSAAVANALLTATRARPFFLEKSTEAAPVAPADNLPFPINRQNQRRYAATIQRIATRYRLDPALIHAVISAESGFDPGARSHAGARGLMQLMPATARHLGVADPDDPAANIAGGARYLRRLLDRFKDLELALAAYNAGEAAVLRYGYTIPPYRETRQYVPRVLAFYRYFKG